MADAGLADAGPGLIRVGEGPSGATWLMAAATTAALLSPVSPGVQLFLLLAAVALIGAPHGVFDIALLRRAEAGALASGLPTALYVGLIGAVLAGWTLAPAATLSVFLASALVHFGGEGEARDGRPVVEAGLHGFARGASILVPLVFSSPTSIAWMASLAGAPVSQVQAAVHAGWTWAIAGWLLALGASLALYARRADWRDAAELCALALMFRLAPPVLAFSVYFAGVHSVRHVLRARRRLGPVSRPAALGWTLAWLAPAVLVGVATVGGLYVATGAAAAATSALRLLAALALPHLVLGPWLERRMEGARPGQPAYVRPSSACSPRASSRSGFLSEA